MQSTEHQQPDRGSSRRFLDASYADRDAIKRRGALWDQSARRWFAPAGTEDALARWIEHAPLPQLLPGEDRSFGSGLFVDLVPASCWFTDVRTSVTPHDWSRIRHLVFGRAHYTCEACGIVQRPGEPARMQAHERWLHDTANHTQQLRRLICLCNRCHFATHFDYAESIQRDRSAYKQLRSVNEWSKRVTHNHITEAKRLRRERSKTEWIIDVDMLTSAGITVIRPPD